MNVNDGKRCTYVSLSSLPRFWNPAIWQLDSVGKDDKVTAEIPS